MDELTKNVQGFQQAPFSFRVLPELGIYKLYYLFLLSIFVKNITIVIIQICQVMFIYLFIHCNTPLYN